MLPEPKLLFDKRGIFCCWRASLALERVRCNFLRFVRLLQPESICVSLPERGFWPFDDDNRQLTLPIPVQASRRILCRDPELLDTCGPESE
jgi:hypothetical protein